MARTKPKTAQTCPPVGNEVATAFHMIAAGKSDAAIATTLSAARPHGQFRIEPKHIADLRNGR